MTDIEQRKIFSKNLNRLVERSDKTQKEIADAINVSPQTFNTWMKGIAIPRMGKIQALADYFGVSKSELVDNKIEEEYYINPETAALAQEIMNNRELSALFDVERNLPPTMLKAIYGLVLSMKLDERERGQ